MITRWQFARNETSAGSATIVDSLASFVDRPHDWRSGQLLARGAAGAVLAVVLAVAAGVSPVLASPAGTSPTSAPSTYRERVEGVTVVVDSYPASLHARDAYFPLHVAVSLGPGTAAARLTLESFVLVDDRGIPTSPATFGEIAGRYTKRGFDRSLLEHRPLRINDAWVGDRRVASSFYPPTGSRRTRTERLFLAPRTWFHDVIYFPRPEAGLDGVLTLRLQLDGREQPIEVRFAV